jgi:hypothetical protein
VAQTIVFCRLRWQATKNDGLPHLENRSQPLLSDIA